MPSPYIPKEWRTAVIERANGRCEYCLKPQVSYFAHEVDHVTARKHGGETTLDNLAFACFECNRNKGSDIASVDPESGELTFLFNPRTQKWNDHFHLLDGRIEPLTAYGRVTVFLLQLNHEGRVQERVALGIGV
ncbi:MAG: HNH endonuclease [Anaerolineae bacterium]|nr:HNH endonuclease [Anaerolineae bacterium]